MYQTDRIYGCTVNFKKTIHCVQQPPYMTAPARKHIPSPDRITAVRMESHLEGVEAG